MPARSVTAFMVGVEFDDCEFHRCLFENCNTWKFRLRNVYVDPGCFLLSRQHKRTAANVGIELFQKLYDNSMATHQSLFAATADIQRRRWRRHQWLYDYRRRDASVLESFRKIGGNLAFDITCKYGYGPWQFLLVSGVVFLLVAGITKGFWASMGIMKGAVPLEMVTYTDALYYAMLLITTLGFSELLPTTTIGKLVAVSYALFGISWMGLFTAILIRRVIR